MAAEVRGVGASKSGEEVKQVKLGRQERRVGDEMAAGSDLNRGGSQDGLAHAGDLRASLDRV